MSKETRVTPLRREGFFNNGDNDYPDLPLPIPSESPWKGRKVFLTNLRLVQTKATGNRYKGWSTCRCCGQENGSADHKLEGWVWPEGLIHYVKAHNVRPSTAFIDFINSFAE